MSHVSGYVVALDMTARELQEVAKKRGEPWSVAKGSAGHRPAAETADAPATTAAAAAAVLDEWPN